MVPVNETGVCRAIKIIIHDFGQGNRNRCGSRQCRKPRAGSPRPISATGSCRSTRARIIAGSPTTARPASAQTHQPQRRIAGRKGGHWQHRRSNVSPGALCQNIVDRRAERQLRPSPTQQPTQQQCEASGPSQAMPSRESSDRTPHRTSSPSPASEAPFMLRRTLGSRRTAAEPKGRRRNSSRSAKAGGRPRCGEAGGHWTLRSAAT